MGTIKSNPLVLLTILTIGCGSAGVRVMPGPDGINKAVVRAVEQHRAEKKAVDAAVRYCRERGQETVFIEDKSEYTGRIDEAEREAIRDASEAAAAVAVALRTVDSHDVALIFDAASGVGRSMSSGKDYRAEVSFTCR